MNKIEGLRLREGADVREATDQIKGVVGDDLRAARKAAKKLESRLSATELKSVSERPPATAENGLYMVEDQNTDFSELVIVRNGKRGLLPITWLGD